GGPRGDRGGRAGPSPAGQGIVAETRPEHEAVGRGIAGGDAQGERVTPGPVAGLVAEGGQGAQEHEGRRVGREGEELAAGGQFPTSNSPRQPWSTQIPSRSNPQDTPSTQASRESCFR